MTSRRARTQHADTKEWNVVKTIDTSSGTYYLLNARAKDGGPGMTVKARLDGTYLCLNPDCISELAAHGNRLLHHSDTKGGCVHARYVRDIDRGSEGTSDEAPVLTDRDAPADALSDEAVDVLDPLTADAPASSED